MDERKVLKMANRQSGKTDGQQLVNYIVEILNLAAILL